MSLRSSGLRAFVLGGLAALTVIGLGASSAWAAGGTKLCIKEGKPVAAPKAGVCKPGYTLTELGAEGKEGPAGKEGKEGSAGKEGKEGPEGKEGKEGAPGKEGKEGPEGKQGPEGKEGLSLLSKSEHEQLKAILPSIKYVEVGIGGKPTIQIVGCNLQILSGAGKEET